mmetsp:Transcript_65409/g.121982  ORF Transcript_65409/g.121982 Transcript_65409/m.121982 type:complete len:241 (+) Transcript_65409:1298-2020(+)
MKHIKPHEDGCALVTEANTVARHIEERREKPKSCCSSLQHCWPDEFLALFPVARFVALCKLFFITLLDLPLKNLLQFGYWILCKCFQLLFVANRLRHSRLNILPNNPFFCQLFLQFRSQLRQTKAHRHWPHLLAQTIKESRRVFDSSFYLAWLIQSLDDNKHVIPLQPLLLKLWLQELLQLRHGPLLCDGPTLLYDAIHELLRILNKLLQFLYGVELIKNPDSIIPGHLLLFQQRFQLGP